MTSVMTRPTFTEVILTEVLDFEGLGAGKGNRTLIAITKFFAAIRGGCCGHGVTVGSQRMLS
jgi:hypothetical protein